MPVSAAISLMKHHHVNGVLKSERRVLPDKNNLLDVKRGLMMGIFESDWKIVG